MIPLNSLMQQLPSRKPLDLVDMDSDDKALVADSSTSAATTAPDPMADSPKTPRPDSSLWSAPQRISSFLPDPPGQTSIPPLNWPKGLYPNQQVFYTTLVSRKGSLARGWTLKQLEALASTYAHTPVVVLPPTLAISQVVDRIYDCVHYGSCLLCPFCPDRRYYQVSGWKDHMNSKHSSRPMV